MSGATFVDLTGAFQVQMGGREVLQLAPGSAFTFSQRVNLATNPSFETVSTSYATVRENLIPNPVPADTPGTWYGNYGTGGVGTSGYFSDAPLGQRFQATVTTQGSTTSNGIYFTGGATLRIRVTPGTTLNVAVDLAASTGRRRRIGMEWRDATGQALPSAPPSGYGSWVNPVPNAWQTLTASVVVPADAATANLTLYTDQAVAGDTSGEVISVRRCIISTTPGPYFDGATAPALRTNLFDNPAPASSVRGFGGYNGGTGGVATEQIVAAPYAISGRAVRRTWTTPGIGTGDQGIRVWNATASSRAWTPIAGRRYTVAYSARMSIDTSVSAAQTGTGPHPTLVAESAAQPIGPDTTARLWRTFTATDTMGDARLGISIATSAQASGGWVEVFDVDAYEGDYDPAREFTAPGQHDSTGLVGQWSGAENASPTIVLDPDLTVAWTGAANASTSELRGVRAVTTSPVTSSTISEAISSTRWSQSGARSVRAYRKTSGDAGVQITIVPAGTGAGRTYRVSVTSHAFAPTLLTGTFQVQESGGAYRVLGILAPSGTAVSGTQRWSNTFTVPSDQTAGARLVLRTGPQADIGASVWYDDLLVEDVTDRVPQAAGFFDGDTPDGAEALHHWTGPRHASPSAATSAWPTG